MPSTFSWLDYSEKDRQRAQRVIDLVREHDTRDELGIGTVRDALSDLLFPGTTTSAPPFTFALDGIMKATFGLVTG